MPNVSLTAPYTTQQAELDRRRKLAQALMQESTTPLEMPQTPGVRISPYAGLAKILSGVIGNYKSSKLDKEQRKLDTSKQESIRQQMAQLLNSQGGTTQYAGPVQFPTQRDVTLPPDPEAMASGLGSEFPQVQQLAAALMGQNAKRADTQQAQGFTGEQNLLNRQNQMNIAGIRDNPPQPQAGMGSQGTYFQTGPQAGQIITPAPPQRAAPTMQAENVMLDGKEAKVLRDPQGNYFDANTRQPVTGRITPYNPPPSPRQKGDITPNAEAQLVGSLTNQWGKASKDIQELYRANTIMNAGMDAARRGDMNAGSQAVLITFQKFLDPQSVVRESEYARSGAGLAMANRVRGWYEKNFQSGGAGVPLSELEAFAKLAQEINSRLASEGNSLLSAEKQRISRTAERYSIPPDLIFPAYNYAQPGGSAAPPPNAGGGIPAVGGTFNGAKVLKVTPVQ